MGSKEESTTKEPKDRTISIAVDTDALWAKPYPNTSETDIDDCTFISDGTLSSPYRDPKKNFETEVFRNKKVKWTIASQNVSSIYVRLVSVTHNPPPGNPIYFKKTPLEVGSDGSVEGKIMDIDNLPDDNYTIHFNLLKGNDIRHYPIDPKLRISTKQK